ncbi:MAG: PEP/pyruvate-binding domain-containing protein, partial [Chloroflexota bacterium]
MDHPYLIDIHDARHAETFGRKGSGLFWLRRHHLAIPNTLVLTYLASQKILKEGHDGLSEVGNRVAEKIDLQKSYAIRSSANLEDEKDISFAGQFATKTDVRGIESIKAAIQEVIESGQSETLQPYLIKLGEDDKDLKMAVLIQEMVKPVISGVAFSKNPTTGLDEVVIESVHGLGESLMQSGITPSRWIYRWGQFTTKSEVDLAFEGTIREIANETRRIARLYGAAVDLEWAYDGEKVYWLQIRPITTLNNIPLYSNRISREVLPGIIKPLIASINIPLVNTAWIRLFDSLMGPTNLKPDDLSRIFHYRAYFNMGAIGRIFEILGFPRESLEMLLGFQIKGGRPSPSLQTFRHVPRVMRFAVQAWNYDKAVTTELDGFEKHIDDLRNEEISSLSERELVDRIESLYQFNIGVAYQNIVIPILMGVYNALLGSQLKKVGVEIVEFDLTRGLYEIHNYDPNYHLDRLKELFDRLPSTVQEQARFSKYEQLETSPQFREFIAQLKQFIRKFGHLSDSGNDFSKVPWREDSNAVLRMAIDHVIGSRSNPKSAWDTLQCSAFAKLSITPIYIRARNFRLKREQISSTYTASYGWFRVYFSALSKLLLKKGLLQQEDDIYYISWQDVRVLLEVPERATEIQDLISVHRDEIEKSRDITLPEIIYGNVAPPLSLMKSHTEKVNGIPTSPGYFQGRLKVIRSTEDFDKVQQGDVIAWHDHVLRIRERTRRGARHLLVEQRRCIRRPEGPHGIQQQHGRAHLLHMRQPWLRCHAHRRLPDRRIARRGPDTAVG